MNNLLKPFIDAKYSGEQHAINENGIPYNFMGPGSRLDLWLNTDGTPKKDSIPILKGDFESYLHDKSYYRATKDYEKTQHKKIEKKQLKKVWNADDKFINAMNSIENEKMAPLAGSLISSKQNLEKIGIFPTTVFEGFGVSKDPTARLKATVASEYCKEKTKIHYL